MWRLWKSRNILIFERKHLDWRWVLHQAWRDAHEWKDKITESTESFQQRDQVQYRRNQWKQPKEVG